jgi:hypothetical protein
MNREKMQGESKGNDKALKKKKERARVHLHTTIDQRD